MVKLKASVPDVWQPVRTIQRANAWAKDAVTKVDALKDWETEFGWSPLSLMRGMEFRMSTACTGIDTPIFATNLFAAAIEHAHGPGSSFRVTNVHGCEKNGSCQEEVLWGPHPPRCLFDNMLGWLTAETLQLLKGVKDSDYEKIASIICQRPLNAKCHCVQHGTECYISWSHCNVSGTPCIHHSTFGKRDGMEGVSNKIYCVWVRQRREIKEPSWILENVTEFGEIETRRLLGDIYEINRVLGNSNKQGWRSSRLRQFLVGRLLALTPCIPRSVIFSLLPELASLNNAMVEFFQRRCGFGQSEYMIATDEELAEDLAWARTRPHTHLRYNETELAELFPKWVTSRHCRCGLLSPISSDAFLSTSFVSGCLGAVHLQCQLNRAS